MRVWPDPGAAPCELWEVIACPAGVSAASRCLGVVVALAALALVATGLADHRGARPPSHGGRARVAPGRRAGPLRRRHRRRAAGRAGAHRRARLAARAVGAPARTASRRPGLGRGDGGGRGAPPRPERARGRRRACGGCCAPLGLDPPGRRRSPTGPTATTSSARTAPSATGTGGAIRPSCRRTPRSRASASWRCCAAARRAWSSACGRSSPSRASRG